MARIRTIKPEFFRSHKLYEAEQESGLPLRLAFAGLWTAADREGRFPWKPEELKLDAMPFDQVDFSRVLHALTTRHYIVHYASDSREYGWIPSWNKHQVINNREQPSKIPGFVAGQEVIDACPTRAPRDTDLHKGKGKEGKGREEDSSGDLVLEKTERAVARTAPAVPSDPLYQAVWQSFLGKSKAFTNYPKEAQATKRIIEYAGRHSSGDKVAFTEAVVTKFWDLTQNGSSFWRGQPFTPSALSSSGIFDRVIAEMKIGGDPNWTDHLDDYIAAAEGVEF